MKWNSVIIIIDLTTSLNDPYFRFIVVLFTFIDPSCCLIYPWCFVPCDARARKCLENRANSEDDRVSILEAQLAQAKHIAEEADKKYEEVRLTLHTHCLQRTHS